MVDPPRGSGEGGPFQGELGGQLAGDGRWARGRDLSRRPRLHVHPAPRVQPADGYEAQLHAHRAGVDWGWYLATGAGRASPLLGRGVRATLPTASRPDGSGFGLNWRSARRTRAWRAR